jgi:hypothetical protein
MPPGTAGAVLMTSLSVASGTENFLEGCVRAYVALATTTCKQRIYSTLFYPVLLSCQVAYVALATTSCKQQLCSTLFYLVPLCFDRFSS